ncbi:S1C family serine protease [Butyrivibrio sp. INlla14]|uniref:S1C family serine protease n=1 Tax=Butyrivibrio sp. INlla14 TaxID=1520808 RepID=UPI000876375D|nr:trypsin-like peptidase domain-containing protein [Butyrivibrio sp. INlla14]SCY28695.1 serine protease Do [Butyrivibrio sp. INlla14]
MYEDDKMEQGGVNSNSNLNSTDNANSANEHSSYGSEQAKSNNTYSYNPYSYASGQQNPSPFSGYGNSSYSGGYNNAGAGTGSNNSGVNNYGGYNAGNNNYAYNNQSSAHSYGTYQYGTNTSEIPTQAPKKKNTGAIVVAAIAIFALLVGGIGASYFAIANKSAKTEIEMTQETTQAESEQVAEAQTQDSVKTTTVSAQTSTVVTDVTAVVSEVMPAMVIIHNNYTASASYFGYVQEQEATASGSGIIVGQNDTELLIATNYHVIEGADTLEVIFSDDATVEAVVKGTNSDMDLAVIAVMLDDLSDETKSTIKVATLGDSDQLVLGEPAIAIGNALGYGQSVTTGVISALNRQVELDDGSTREFIQTDAAINPGNSGGALLNVQGEVIGINSNKIGGDTVEGMGYAIPISAAKPIIEQLMNEETKIKLSDEERGYIGISGVSVTSDVSSIYGLPLGVYVADVTSGGGAEAAGIQKGDVIVSFDGTEIASMDDLQTRLQYYAIGTTVKVTVMRQNGSEYTDYTYDVTLGGATNTSGNGGSGSADGTGQGQYDGHQVPAKPEDKNNNGQSEGGH